MTYRNDPYDPKQVALLDQARSTTPWRRPRRRSPTPADVDALTAVRHLHLGDRAPVSLARREIGSLPPHAKADAGKRVNEARAAIQSTFDSSAGPSWRPTGPGGCWSRSRST